MSSRVTVIAATFRRSACLRHLLESLGTESADIGKVIVVDNGMQADIDEVVADSPVPVEVLKPGENLGCGGGIALGLRCALADREATYFWLLDDDAYAFPGALPAMLQTASVTKAFAVVPLVENGRGGIGWFPGPLIEPAWSVIRRRGMTAARFREECGDAPLRWNWAPWPSLLVARGAVERCGLPRSDFWFQGEDLEWTLRLSAEGPCVLAPSALCRHEPPKADNAEREFLKQCLMLQNMFFVSTRLPHGRRALRHAPGNVFRFLSSVRFKPRGWVAVAQAIWWGMILGGPAGRAASDGFRRKWMQWAG